MKKLWCIFALLTLLMTGCSGNMILETVTDAWDDTAIKQMQTVSVTLPKDATVEAMEDGTGGKLYLCNGYTVTVQTMAGGDLDKTLRELTGFSKDQLTLLERQNQNCKRYDCVWTSAGEGEDQVARGTVLDDGYYHYAVVVMAPFSKAEDFAATWQSILSSVQLSTD